MRSIAVTQAHSTREPSTEARTLGSRQRWPQASGNHAAQSAEVILLRAMADTAVRIRPAERADAAKWLEMRYALWPEGSVDEHASEIERFFSGQAREPLAVLIAEDPAGRPLGFAELSIRPYAEDCGTDRVAFLEGWYVAPGSRRRGVGGRLVAASEDWARTQGCTEFASDAVLDDAASIAAHRALGFADAGRLQCFRKDL